MVAGKGIRKLELETKPLREMWEFYGRTLGLPVSRLTSDGFTLTAGDSQIMFLKPAAAKERPFYHFAFNITENKCRSALEWLKTKTPTIPNGDQDLFHFPNWNAHAMYFVDPAENVVEFIGRHDLKHRSTGAFSLDDILCVSEIGIVVDDVPGAVARAQESLHINPYRGTNLADFAAVGDDHALLILVKKGRVWLPASLSKPASIHRVSATLAGAPGNLDLGRPYTIIRN
jgi:catechol-2,3-dioxygenase